jgi:hypothetical protein
MAQERLRFALSGHLLQQERNLASLALLALFDEVSAAQR